MKSVFQLPLPESSSSSSTKKQNATLAQRIEILDWHHQNSGNQTKTAAHWNKIYPALQLKQPTLSSWLKDESKWRAQWAEAQAQGDDGKRKRRKITETSGEGMGELGGSRSVSEDTVGDEAQALGENVRKKKKKVAEGPVPDVDGVVEPGVSRSVGEGAVARDDGLRNVRVESVSTAQGREEESSASVSRLENSVGSPKGTGTGATETDVASQNAQVEQIETERARIRVIIAERNYALKDIFCLDDTGLFYAMPPDCRSMLEQRKSGACLTFGLVTNADGSEKLPLFIIGTTTRPGSFMGKTAQELGFYYRYDMFAWMTIKHYQDWLSDWDKRLQREGRRVLLLQPGKGVRIPPGNITNIKVENLLVPDTTLLQPNDAGITRCFKALYRTKLYSRALDRFDAGVPSEQIHVVNQLDAMRIAEAAWHDVDSETIRCCWRKAGVVPELVLLSAPPVGTSSDAADQIVDAQKQLSDVLERLQNRGVLQKEVTLNIDDLVSSPDERDLMRKTVTDEDIRDAVLEQRRDEERVREVNDGDNGPVEERPSRKETLKAVRTLQRYLETVNKPYARELERELADFGKEIRHWRH